jgi:hypothetical protein
LSKHKTTALDRARDELFSHIQRCGVLSASPEDQKEWLKDTMEYVSDRYPDLTDLQVASIEVMGRRYMAPVIPHGRGLNARTREEWKDADEATDPTASGDAETTEAQATPSEDAVEATPATVSVG